MRKGDFCRKKSNIKLEFVLGFKTGETSIFGMYELDLLYFLFSVEN